MTQWAQPRIYYHAINNPAVSPGSTLAATTTASGFSVANVYDMREGTWWKAANTTTPMYITLDTYATDVFDADYIAVCGHNLKTVGATIGLHYSTDNFASDIHDAFTPFAPSSDKAFVKEFTSPGAKRYWRLYLTGTLSAAPQIAIAVWGKKTTLDYATAAFDPYEEEVKAAVNLSQGGVMAGINIAYSERSLALRIDDADAALYAKVKGWWDVSGLKNCFVAWDYANNPADVWLMRPDMKFSNPFKGGGLYRDIAINLKGRKE